MTNKAIVLSALQPFFACQLGESDIKNGLVSPETPLGCMTKRLQLPITYVVCEYNYKNTVNGYLNGEKLPQVTSAENQAALDALISAPVGATYVTATEGYQSESANGWYSVYLKESYDSWSLLFVDSLKP